MPIRFDETMSGTVLLPEGERRLSFQVTAAGPSALALLSFGALALSGRVSLEGVVEGAPLLAASHLEIGIPRHRFLRYQLQFDDPAGNRYRFHGEKIVHLRRLVATMTTLEGKLERNGQVVGAGTLRFALRDLPRFLASFRDLLAAG